MDISFILVEPKVPENIGAAARAIKTMGYSTLLLVKPCPYKEGRARWVAHGSDDILDRAIIYDTLEEAIRSHDLVVGTTARYRITKSEYIDLRVLGEFLESHQDNYHRIAIVFGREESGLTNHELDMCDITSNIRMAASYPSLNLAQAVMLYAYQMNQMKTDMRKNTWENPDHESIKGLKEKVNLLLSDTSIDSNRALKGRIMERLSLASSKDMNLMHSIANSLITKYYEGRK